MLIARHHFQLKAKRKKEKRTELSYDLYYVWNEAEKMKKKKKKKKIVDGDDVIPDDPLGFHRNFHDETAQRREDDETKREKIIKRNITDMSLVHSFSRRNEGK